MCKPSATRAIEPNSRPPATSASIMAPHSPITAQVLRSLRSWPAPRNVWECRDGKVGCNVPLIRRSPEIRAHDVEKLLGCLALQRLRMLVGIDQVSAHVVLDDLRHQSGDSTPDACDEVHDLIAPCLVLERTLYPLDLPADPAHAAKELVLVTDGVAHGSDYGIGTHPIKGRIPAVKFLKPPLMSGQNLRLLYS